jgi:cytochrome b pre-mRNA-processing protein 3
MPHLPTWLAKTLLTPRTHTSRTAGEIYGSIVASARQKTFYAAWGIPDTREGRFEMLALHMALVMRRLGRAEPSGATLSRALAEAFITDMDDNMREIGIGDLAVPRKIKKAGAALFDRHRDYGAALEVRDTGALTAALTTALPVNDTMPPSGKLLDSSALCAYTERLWGALQVVSDADCLAGRLPLPFPPDNSPPDTSMMS